MTSRPLGEICEFAYGDGLKEENRRGGPVPVYGSNGIVGYHDRSITKAPAIIVGRKGSIGEVHFSAAPCFPIDTTYFIDETKLPCDLRWLYFTLLELDLTRFDKSAAIPGLNRDDAYQKIIPFPSLAEQKRIAAILERANRLRRLRRYAIEHCQPLLSTGYLRLFGDPRTNPRNVPVRELGEYIAFLTSGSRGWAEHYVKSGARFIRSLDVQMNRIPNDDAVFVDAPPGAEAERTKVQAGDVLLTVTGSRIGRVAPVEPSLEGAYVSQHVAIIRLKAGLLPRFVSMFLSLETGGQLEVQRFQYGQTKPGLALNQIGKFRVQVPALEKQRQFTVLADHYESLRAIQSESLRQAEHLFQTLLHRAFTSGM